VRKPHQNILMILIVSKFIKAANQIDLKVVAIICNQNSSKVVIINILFKLEGNRRKKISRKYRAL